jgi:quercetin dioxygenase-like cupin family protein
MHMPSNEQVPDSRVVLRPISACRQLSKPHADYAVVNDSEDAFRIVLIQVLHPLSESPMHVHECAPELFIILGGSLTVFTDRGTVTAPSGSMLYVPEGVPHGVRNLSDSEEVTSVVMIGSDYQEAKAYGATV